MRLLADESVDRPIVDRLRRAGCEVDYVAEFDPGIIDDVVIERARAQSSLLITADKDFGELVFRLQRVSHGLAQADRGELRDGEEVFAELEADPDKSAPE